MGVFQSIAGTVRVELTAAEPARALDAIAEKGIEIFHTTYEGDLTLRFTVRRRDFRLLRHLCEKQGNSLRLVEKQGIYWAIKGILGRPVLVLGAAGILLAALLLPTRVFFVRVEGNETVPTRLILAGAEDCGIRFGASRREVRSERVKNALLEAVPQLKWAGVNTYGCVAVISVGERCEPQTEQSGTGVCSIVADRDGVIVSGTVVSGNGLFRVGQAVKQGQVLISGYTDCGICIRADRAEGEIFAQTNRNLTVVTPLEYRFRGEQREERKNFGLIIGKKRINLWKDSGICDSSCGRMYEEYYITLPGDFQLPVALAVETHTCYETRVEEIDQEASGQILSEFAHRYLEKQMVAGYFLEKQQRLAAADGVCRLDGAYVCVEMIGRVVPEKIGEYNGKDS